MSAFTAINLDQIPAPEIIEKLDFEAYLAALKTDLLLREPDLEFALDLESEPITKLLEIVAYREVILRQRVNDAGRGVMLPYAVGSDLENLGALFGVTRLVVQEADEQAIPPVPEILEDDTRLRRRIQLSLEGFAAAGPRGSYLFWGLSASALVKDVSVVSPSPGEVRISVLSTVGQGVPDQALLDAVDATLNDEDIRPLTDHVTVYAADILTYSVDATLTLYEGPDSAVVLAEAQAAIEAFVAEHHRMGHDINLSGIYAALHRAGVQNVVLNSPAANIEVDDTEAAFCTGITLSVGGRDV